MKPPIPPPYAEEQINEKAVHLAGLFVYSLAIGCSAVLIWLAQHTLFLCFDTIGAPYGTPIVRAALFLLSAPAVLTAPFTPLLWAKNLPKFGLIARCAVTTGLGIWGASLGIIFFLH